VLAYDEIDHRVEVREIDGFGIQGLRLCSSRDFEEVEEVVDADVFNATVRDARYECVRLPR